MTPKLSGRIIRTFNQNIEAPPDHVFPLLCPVREGEWLDGWAEECEMIHSSSGFAEEGCIFQTRMPGRPVTTWMITKHHLLERVVEFARITEGLVATNLQIKVEPRGADASSVWIQYIHTPLSEAGRSFLAENYHESAFREDMAWWEDSMNHWLSHGDILRAPVEQQ
jgi:hypothetical protein